MTQFNKCVKICENKFKTDQELAFRVEARRNKLLGLWAADLMGIDDASAETYAKDVVVSDFEAPGDGDMLQEGPGRFDWQGCGIFETSCPGRDG